VQVGSQSFALASQTLAARSALEAYAGRPVVLGIRPESLEDAALAPQAEPRGQLRGTVLLREALGSEIVAHVRIDARPAFTDEVQELALDVGDERAGAAPEATIVGRFDPRSRIEEGAPTEISVDTDALHFFDPESGSGIYDQSTTKGAVT
jgi:multiple sugar transport system ATP-binding protein